MGNEGSLRALRWLRLSILPATSALVLGVGVVSWLRVPSPDQIVSRAAERDALQMRLHERDSRTADEQRDEDDLAAKLPLRLSFADFLERLNESAATAGIDGLHIESSASNKNVAPSDGLRGFSGTVRFDAAWNDLVRFLAEIEHGMPVMRVRSLLAEPTDESIRVECVVDAWSLPAAVEDVR